VLRPRYIWTSGELDVASGPKERCDASQDAQNAWDAEYPALASGGNAAGSDTRSVFADVSGYLNSHHLTVHN